MIPVMPRPYPSWWERFQAKVTAESQGHTTPCWVWMALTSPDGYGRFKLNKRSQPAHRVSYEACVGLIPDGFVVDHICHNAARAAGSCVGGPACPHRRCVNPEHLEAVTHQENLRRRDALYAGCAKGHPFDELNTYLSPDGRRRCRECHRLAQARYLARTAK